MRVRLTQSVESPEGVADATVEVFVVYFCLLEPESHRRYAFRGHGAVEPVASVVVLRHQPLCVYAKLDDFDTEFLPPKPCNEHAMSGVDRTRSACSFYVVVLAVKPCTNKRPRRQMQTIQNHQKRIAYRVRQV